MASGRREARSIALCKVRMSDVDESNIIHVIFRKKATDGGKYRILRRRKAAKDDLTMDHADPALELPSDVAP